MKKLPCHCDEDGCICDRAVVVYDYVSDKTKTICSECSKGNHKKPRPKPLKSTDMKEVHKDMFVQGGG